MPLSHQDFTLSPSRKLLVVLVIPLVLSSVACGFLGLDATATPGPGTVFPTATVAATTTTPGTTQAPSATNVSTTNTSTAASTTAPGSPTSLPSDTPTLAPSNTTVPTDTTAPRTTSTSVPTNTPTAAPTTAVPMSGATTVVPATVANKITVQFNVGDTTTTVDPDGTVTIPNMTVPSASLTIQFPRPTNLADVQVAVVDPQTVSWTVQNETQPAPDQIHVTLHAPSSPANGYFTIRISPSGYSPFTFTVQVGS